MCLILIVAVTTVIVAECDLTATGLRFEKEAERRQDAEYAFEGAISQVIEDYSNDALALPASRQIVVGDVTCNLTVTDNSATLPRTLTVAGQATVKGGFSFPMSRVVGARHAPSVFFYALAISGATTSAQPLVTGGGGADGDVYCAQDLTLSATGNVVNGDLESSGLVVDPGTTVTGVTYSNAGAVDFPTPSAQAYQDAADVVFPGPAMAGYTFGTGGMFYTLVYCPGSLDISGQIGGRGTIFVNGDVTVSADLTYANASSELAVVASGNITFQSGATVAVGYFFSPASIQTAGSLTITRGGLVGRNVSWLGTLQIANDPDVWDNESEGPKLRLPGMWP
jgi:cytoskeletal protein CcmA (bactofilin family)